MSRREGAPEVVSSFSRKNERWKRKWERGVGVMGREEGKEAISPSNKRALGGDYNGEWARE